VEIKAISQQILVSRAVKDPDFVNYKLPAKIIEQEIADSIMVERSADATFEDFARGKIIFFNDQEEEQQLLPKTNLRHEETGVFFLTDTGVAIPPQGETGMTVTAKNKGASGNVPSGRFIVDKLPPHLQTKIYAESTQPFSGGVAVEKPLNEAEVEAAKDKLKGELVNRLKGMLTSEAGGAPLREDLISFNTEEIHSSGLVGSKASEYEIAGKVKGKAFLLDDNDSLALTLLKLRSSADAEQEFIAYDPHSFKATMVRRDVERGEAVVEGTLSGSFASKIGASVFSGENLAGLSTEEVKAKLSELAGVGEVEVELSPWWVKVVPSSSGRVEIVVAQQEN